MFINTSVNKGENGILHTGVLLCHKKEQNIYSCGAYECYESGRQTIRGSEGAALA